jgi:hypothetical protein
VQRHPAEQIRLLVVARRTQLLDDLGLGRTGRQHLGDRALEDDVRGVAEQARAEHGEHHARHAQEHHEQHAHAMRAETREQALGRWAERHRLLDGHPHAAERSAAARAAARDRRPGGRGDSAGLGLRLLAIGRLAHAASSAASWDSTISA